MSWSTYDLWKLASPDDEREPEPPEACEYCEGEPVVGRMNRGRMEKLCELCDADFQRGDELQRRYDLANDVEEDTQPLPRPLEDR